MISVPGLFGVSRSDSVRGGNKVRSAAATARAGLRRLAVLVLAGFHAWLFWAELGDGRLADPAVAFRWAWGGLILAGLLAVRRSGLPGRWRRTAVVLWLFVVLLHCQAVASRPGVPFDAAALPERFYALAAPLTLGPAGMAIGVLAIALLAGQHRPAFRPMAGVEITGGPAGILCAGHVPHLASRPPPA